MVDREEGWAQRVARPTPSQVFCSAARCPQRETSRPGLNGCWPRPAGPHSAPAQRTPACPGACSRVASWATWWSWQSSGAPTRASRRRPARRQRCACGCRAPASPAGPARLPRLAALSAPCRAPRRARCSCRIGSNAWPRAPRSGAPPAGAPAAGPGATAGGRVHSEGRQGRPVHQHPRWRCVGLGCSRPGGQGAPLQAALPGGRVCKPPLAAPWAVEVCPVPLAGFLPCRRDE